MSVNSRSPRPAALDQQLATARLDDLLRRGRTARPFVVTGTVWVLLGGLLAAVARPLALDAGSWAAAFLVLVGGVAQIGSGVGQAWLTDDTPTRARLRAELVLWNGAVVLTVAGTAVGRSLLTALGGLALAAALVTFLAAGASGAAGRRPWLWVYRGVVAVVAVGIPVGVALSWIRHR